jgi:hypothetical protein
MISNDGRAVTPTAVLAAANAANTAAATSGYIDMRAAKGEIVFLQIQGVTTGTLTGKIQGATDSTGGGVADITGATFTAGTGTGIQKCVVAASAAPYMRYVGTIVTGPVQIAVGALLHPGSV